MFQGAFQINAFQNNAFQVLSSIITTGGAKATLFIANMGRMMGRRG